MTPPRASGGTFAALRHRNFRLLWISLLVSNSGTWLQSVAQDFLVYRLTGRALDLGLVNVVRAIALIGLSFFGGALADRMDKKRLLLFTQSAFAALAVLLGVLVQTGTVRVWHVVVLAFLNAVLLAADQPTRQSLLPQLVPREDLGNAIALNSVTFTGAAAIGPALAGPLVALVGLGWAFQLNALSFAAVIGAVWALRLPAREKEESEPVGRAVAAGVRYVRASPTILLLVGLLSVFSFFAVPYQSVLPVFADRVFGGGVRELGWLRAAPGVGALAGGFLFARFSRFPHKGQLAVAGFVAFSIALLLFARTGRLPLALPLLFLAGGFATLFTSTVQTLLQHQTDDKMRGRVMSLFAICVIGMWPLGALPLSWASDRFGVQAATTAGALIALLYALSVAFRKRALLADLRT